MFVISYRSDVSELEFFLDASHEKLCKAALGCWVRADIDNDVITYNTPFP